MIRFVAFLFFFTIGNAVFSQDQELSKNQVDKEDLPVPAEENQLFYLQRDPDANTVIYVLNLEEGELNLKDPVQAYWIRYADKGQKQKLSFIQRKMAYGIGYKDLENGDYELFIQAYKPLQILLTNKNKSGKYHAYVEFENQRILLNRIFVRIAGGSLFKPNIQYVEIQGINVQNNKVINHKFELKEE